MNLSACVKSSNDEFEFEGDGVLYLGARRVE